jgi:hypothetical protein
MPWTALNQFLGERAHVRSLRDRKGIATQKREHATTGLRSFEDPCPKLALVFLPQINVASQCPHPLDAAALKP